MVRTSMSALIFYQLLMCATVVAFNMFNFMVNGIAINFDFIVSFYELLCSVIPTFIYSYIANEVMSSLLYVGDIFFECPWYELTPNQQKLLILVIERAQVKFYFDGFSLVHCSLHTFTSVIWLILDLVECGFWENILFFVRIDNPNCWLILSAHS